MIYVLTTPFADDFDLISSNLTRHQKLQSEVQMKAESMGLTFKPSKCRSLSIKGGRVSSDYKFFLLAGNGEKAFLKTMEDDPISFSGPPSPTGTHQPTTSPSSRRSWRRSCPT